MNKISLILFFISIFNNAIGQIEFDSTNQSISIYFSSNNELNIAYIKKVIEFPERKKFNYLEIQCDSLTKFPLELFSINWIKSLHIYFVNLFPELSLPKEIDKLTELKILTIGESNIIEIDRRIYLPKLESFSIFSSKLNSFPSFLLSCSTLKGIAVERSGIKEIPKKINRLSNLTTLSFTDNAVKSLPKNLFKVKTLRILICEANQISEITDAVENLENLETLNLVANPIKKWSNRICHLSALNTFSFGGALGGVNPPCWLENGAWKYN